MKSSTVLAISWLTTLASYAWAGTYPGDSSSAKRAFLQRGIQYQLSAGLSSTNLLYSSRSGSSGSVYAYDRSAFVRLDLFAIKPVGRRVDVRLGVAYEPMGHTDTYQMSVNELAITNVRLFFGNVHAMVGYQPFLTTPKVRVHVLGGLFAGRLFRDDIISRLQPGGQVFVNKSLATYSGWNAGATLSVAGAVRLAGATAVGLKMTYQPGLLSILTSEASDYSGTRVHTTAASLSAFYQF